MNNILKYHARIIKGRRISLVEHLYNTVYVTLKTMLSRRLWSLAIKSSRNSENASMLYGLFLVPIALHDIGKITPLYQDPPSTWRLGSYRMHEVISGIVLDECIEKLLVNSDLERLSIFNHKALQYILITPILMHHYAMRDIRTALVELVKLLNRFSQKLFIINKVDVDELLRYLTHKLSHKLHTETLTTLLDSLRKCIVEESSKESLIRLDNTTIALFANKFSNMLSPIGMEPGFRTVSIYGSALTGLLGIADYAAGSIEACDERGGYAGRVLGVDYSMVFRELMGIYCI